MAHTFHRYKVGDEPVAGYRLEGHLGTGGFGEVWKAIAPGGTEVALKIIDLTGQQGVQEFASLRVVKKVRHPNLIALQAFWMKDESGQIIDEAGQAPVGNATTSIDVTAPVPDPKRQTQVASIAMTAQFAKPVELIIAMQLGAKSLYKRLEECREQSLPGVPVAELLEYLEQAARGIDFLNKPIHDMGKGPMPIVHGDIKPHNILVVGDAAVVCDFGLARAVETLRKTSMAPVTVAYAAPESFKGKVTPTSDQYSLAITYVELRTGRLPFDETMTPYQVMEAHVLRTLDFSRLPEPERLVIERATEHEPESRWSSSREMILALRQAAAATGELSLRPGEAAFSGGITPTHAITGRPMARDTDRHTQIKADPHKETSYPRGHTPSKSLLQDTAHMTPSRISDGLAETSMLPPSGEVPQPAKKSRGLLVSVICLAAAAALVAVLLPVLNKATNLPNGTTQATTTIPGGTNLGTTTPPVVIEVDPDDPNAPFIRSVQKHINERDFASAADLLVEKSPSTLPAHEKEYLQTRLKEAFISYIGSFIDRRAYPQALNEIEYAPKSIGLTKGEVTQQRERVRNTWLAEAQDAFQNDQFAKAIDTADAFLTKFSADRDATLIVARANIGLPNYKAAAAALNQLGKTAELPADYQPLHAALLLVATGLDSSTETDWTKLLDGFVERLSIEQGATTPEALKLSPGENAKLDQVRGETVASVQQTLSALPADQKKVLTEKLEKLGGSAELEMIKIKLLLDEKNYDESRKLLTELASKTPQDNEDLKHEITATSLLIDLLDPAKNAETVAKSINAAAASLDNFFPAMRNELCAAAEALALGSQATALEPTITLVSKARDLDPLDQAMKARLARLLVARLTLRAAGATLPSKNDLAKLVQDCELVGAVGLATGTVNAFHAECLLALDSRDRQLLTTLVDQAKPVDDYTRFVQARVLRTMPQPNWPEIANLLTAAYADPAKQSPALSAPFRRSAAARLLIEATTKKRSAPPTEAAAVFAIPFADAKAAGDAFSWLQLASALSKDVEAADLKLNDAQQRGLKINRALASAWKSNPDDALAQSQSVELTKLSDSELGPNALPVLLTAFRSNEGKSGDQSIAVASAKRLIELFQKQFPVADAQGVELYKQVVQPALALADGLTATKKSKDIDAFFASVADFIGHYKRATWPFADKHAEIEKLLTKAIAIDPKVAKYFTARGVARVSQRPPNIEGALSDAAEAAKLKPDLAAADSLQGHALIYRSRGQSTRADRLDDLEQALVKAKSAIEKSKPDDKQRAMYLLYASMAHLEKANFENDPKIKQSHLEEAVKQAEQAVAIEKAYPDYAYTALGNALEDMAWIANVDAEKNYLAAIEAFRAAIESNPASPDPWIGRARCFYKSLADSKLDPKFLQRTKEEAFEVAISDLEQAKQLNADLVEPHLWLGKANQQLGKLSEADASFAVAVDLAEKQKLPEQAIYLIDWTRNAIQNTTIPTEERGKLVRERAAKLTEAPSLGGTSNTKQAALLIGESLVAERKFAEAIKEYDAALAEYDKPELVNKPLDPAKSDGSDVSLFLARAFTRLNLPDAQWNLTTAEGVLKDAARIGQLKPDPKFEALANWYAARARAQSLRATSPTLAEFKKQALDPAITEIRKAIQLAPSDPNSWDWRSTGSSLIGARVSIPATALPALAPDKLKSLASEARRWIDEAINTVSKRPDLATQMDLLQRRQQDLEKSLKAKGL